MTATDRLLFMVGGVSDCVSISTWDFRTIAVAAVVSTGMAAVGVIGVVAVANNDDNPAIGAKRRQEIKQISRVILKPL